MRCLTTGLVAGICGLSIALAGVARTDEATTGTQPEQSSATTYLDSLPELQPTVLEYKPQRRILIYSPPDHSIKTNARPLLIFIHGGGWGQGNPEMFSLQCRYFALRGWVAATVQYRLTSQQGVTVFDCIADVKSAVRWVRAHADKLGIDPGKIVALGDSAGGHLAACTGIIVGLDAKDDDLTVSSRANAMVLFNPVADTVPPDGWRFYSNANTGIVARAKEFSPLHNVAPGVPPTLVMTGTADHVTPLAWSERLVEALKKAGNQAELVALEGKQHAFVIRGCGDDDTLLKALQRVETFLGSIGYTPPH
jgi:acetyl esterase/lipase